MERGFVSRPELAHLAQTASRLTSRSALNSPRPWRGAL
jgi:hypothetical protein